MNAPVLRISLSDLVDEYDRKHGAASEAAQAFEDAKVVLRAASVVGTAYGGLSSRDSYSVTEIRKSLLKSAWRQVYDGLQIATIAGAKERGRLEQMLEQPPAFTMLQLREVFGDYLLRSRYHILKGLAEVFADLDPAFRSHEKVKIGVKGLPKRVIVSGFGTWREHGREHVQSIINAARVAEGRPMFDRAAAIRFCDLPEEQQAAEFGVWLRTFQNGNGHLYFGPEMLLQVNRALGEFYGEVLPDTPDENVKRRTGTAVSKDLQYYPTPAAAVEKLLDQVSIQSGTKVLEPSCGCGRIMDAARKAGAAVFGIEVDPGRAAECRAKGHDVLTANFLQVEPRPTYDVVLMNPPFYGRHYLKHIDHARRFLKPGGRLVAILPSTARYDHGALPEQDRYRERWIDLPVGSFAESGTNVNTSIYKEWNK